MSAQHEHAFDWLHDDSRERVDPWLHDDMEEDLVGAEWHQHAIHTLVTSLRDLADERQWSWHVGDQLTLVAWKPAGGPWRPSPDVMVHPYAGPAARREISARDEGIPALVVEVASASTWHYDVDTTQGKVFGYMGLGVPDYLVFDPTGEHLGQPCRGWQVVDGVAREWRPDADGRYQTQTLGIALRPENDLLRVLNPQGEPVPFAYENAHAARRLRQETEQQARELAELHAELERLRRRE